MSKTTLANIILFVLFNCLSCAGQIGISNDTAIANKKQTQSDSCYAYSFNSINNTYFLEHYIENTFGDIALKKLNRSFHSKFHNYYIINKSKTQYMMVFGTLNVAQLNIGLLRNKNYSKLNFIYSDIDSFYLQKDIRIGTDISYFFRKYSRSCNFKIDTLLGGVVVDIRIYNPETGPIKKMYTNFYPSRLRFINNKLAFCEVGGSYVFDRMFNRSSVSKKLKTLKKKLSNDSSM